MPDEHPEGATRFAGYPSAFVYESAEGGTAVQHLLWGDWLRIEGPPDGGRYPVRARGVDGWMNEADIQPDRLLEIGFMDVGQGDGCLIVTPDDKHIVVDAGLDYHMYRFLRWRYGGFRSPWRFEMGIITHPDQDHYGGFDDIFPDPFVTFETIYHNGIMERYGGKPLGPTERVGRRSYLTDLVEDREDLEAFLAERSNWEKVSHGRTYRKQYPAMLAEGLENGSFDAFDRLTVADGFIPGYGPDQDVTMELLGPVPEPADAADGRLRTLGSTGETKNGHSIVFKLVYGNLSVFLGGDLNIPAQELLLEHHTGLDPRPGSIGGHDALVAAAREVFQVDVAKACHHGAADVSTRFLAALNPCATVISSGDEESHAHPRADTLGMTGVNSRGIRPLIFSTELTRSTRELHRHPDVLRNRLQELRVEIPLAEEGGLLQRRLIREFDEIVDSIDRSVAVYGAIQLRSDGERVVIAQKLERPRGKTKWDLYRLERVGPGPLRYISQYED